jgi:competence protein ComEA
MRKIVLFLVLFISFVYAKVDINKATMDELHFLKGIGHSKAVAIIKYRKKHSFKKIEDIMNVKGIGKKIFEKIKNEIEVKN